MRLVLRQAWKATKWSKQLSPVIPILPVTVRITLYIVGSKFTRPAVEVHVEDQGPTHGLKMLRSGDSPDT